MKSARVWFLLALLPLFAGCFTLVYTEQPLGETVILDSQEWNGRWLCTGSVWYTVSVFDTDTLRVGPSGICDPSTAQMSGKKLRHFEDWYIPEKTEHYPWDATTPSRYRVSDLFRLRGHVWTLFGLNAERVKALVEQGELPGYVEGNRVVLGHLTPEDHKLLFGSGKLTILGENLSGYPRAAKNDTPHYAFPLGVCIKLPDNLDPCKRNAASR